MFTELRLKNFKAWGSELWEHPCRLAPVTLFLGANSSGKTSLIQTLLLLKQTFSSADRTLSLNLGGQENDLLDLGSFKDIVHNHDSKQEVAFGFTTSDRMGYRASFRAVGGVPTPMSLLLVNGEQQFSAQRQSKGGYLLTAPSYDPSHLTGRSAAKRPFAPERSIVFPAEAVAELGQDGGRVQDLSLGLKLQMQHVAYLGPLREPPARTYQWSGQTPGDLGDRGQFAALALLASANTLKKQTKNKEENRGWLVEKTSRWLKLLGIADSLEMVRQGRSRFFEVVVKTAGQRANIVDVGFGVSQVLPLVVLAHFVPRGWTIIAEQPEIHLHPLVQAELADLMVEVSKERDVQFIVETHSEHLFRRMQFLIADGKTTPKDSALYFVEAKDNRAALRELEIDEYGRVQNWPEKFFGDAIGETERQIRRMVERMQQGGE